MTLGRRLLSLWAGLAILWAGAVAGAAYEASPLYPRTDAGQQQCFIDRSDNPGRGNPFACFNQTIMVDDAGIWADPLVTDYLPAAVAPPLVLLLIGIAGTWLVRRFLRG